MSSITKVWGLFIISFVVMCNGAVLPKKRVCVIGAGRAGLAAIKLVADQIDHLELVAVERNSDVGGLWIYRNDSELDEHGLRAHSGIYKHLKTNFPLNFMVYPDYQQLIDPDNSRDFVSHEVFLQYMRNYTDEFQLRKYIQFDTLVTKVIPIGGNGDWMTTTWRMEMRNLNTGRENATNCDAVMVCNGHFSKPYMPDIPGLKDTFPGQVLHSRNYRIPQVFANKTVVLLGAGNSGIDIATDLADYAEKIYLSHRHDYDPFLGEEHPSKVQIVRGVVSANGSEVTLQDNTTMAVDTFIFCTGYAYDFPFLDDSSGIVYDRKHVRPLYEEFVNVEHPSMAFIGLFAAIDYGQLYYSQSTNFLELLKGKKKLPSYKEMLENSKSVDNFLE